MSGDSPQVSVLAECHHDQQVAQRRQHNDDAEDDGEDGGEDGGHFLLALQPAGERKREGDPVSTDFLV